MTAAVHWVRAVSTAAAWPRSARRHSHLAAHPDITAVFNGSTNFVTSTSSDLDQVVTQATPTVTLTSPSSMYNGGAYADAVALVAGTMTGVDTAPAGTLEGTGLTLTYYVGSSTSGTLLTSPPTLAGTYTVVASFAGSTDYVSATSSAVTFVMTSGAVDDPDGTMAGSWQFDEDTGTTTTDQMTGSVRRLCPAAGVTWSSNILPAFSAPAAACNSARPADRCKLMATTWDREISAQRCGSIGSSAADRQP